MSSGAGKSHTLSRHVVYAEVWNICAPYLDDAIAFGRRAELAKKGQMFFFRYLAPNIDAGPLF